MNRIQELEQEIETLRIGCGKEKKEQVCRLAYLCGYCLCSFMQTIGKADELRRRNAEIKEDYTELLNNLNDDLTLDLNCGEKGYGSYKECYEAIKKYTLPLLIKKLTALGLEDEA